MDTPAIGIVGGGVVGFAVKNFFPHATVYDKYKLMDSIEDVARARFIFICVPTPNTNGRFDGSMMDDAVENTVKHLKKPEGQLVVIKSTVLPGTTQKYQDQYPDVKFAFNPEFLRDQTANEDFVKTDRQLVGYTTRTKDSALLKELLEILPPAPYERILPSSAVELIKYAANTFLALRVIFANQIYDVCASVGADYENVKKVILADKRIGKSHWEIMHTEKSLDSTKSESYRGYGGKCFPKDVNGLIEVGEKLGVDVGLLVAAREINFRLNGGKYDR